MLWCTIYLIHVPANHVLLLVKLLHSRDCSLEVLIKGGVLTCTSSFRHIVHLANSTCNLSFFVKGLYRGWLCACTCTVYGVLIKGGVLISGGNFALWRWRPCMVSSFQGVVLYASLCSWGTMHSVLTKGGVLTSGVGQVHFSVKLLHTVHIRGDVRDTGNYLSPGSSI